MNATNKNGIHKWLQYQIINNIWYLSSGDISEGDVGLVTCLRNVTVLKDCTRVKGVTRNKHSQVWVMFYSFIQNHIPIKIDDKRDIIYIFIYLFDRSFMPYSKIFNIPRLPAFWWKETGHFVSCDGINKILWKLKTKYDQSFIIIVMSCVLIEILQKPTDEMFPRKNMERSGKSSSKCVYTIKVPFSASICEIPCLMNKFFSSRETERCITRKKHKVIT